MIEAWLRLSEIIASSSLRSGSNTPPLASKQAANTIASSLPRWVRDGALKLTMQRLRPANEAHRGHAEAERVHRRLRGGDHLGVVRKPEIVVGAEVEHLPLDAALPRGDADASALGARDQALSLEEPGCLDLLLRVARTWRRKASGMADLPVAVGFRSDGARPDKPAGRGLVEPLCWAPSLAASGGAG